MIALTERIPWESTDKTPLHTFVQKLVFDLCAMRGVLAPTLPPVAPAEPRGAMSSRDGQTTVPIGPSPRTPGL